MEISFREIEIEDCDLIRNWIKSNEYTRQWYFFNHIPQKRNLIKKIEEIKTEPQTNASLILINNFPIGYIQSYPVDGNGNWTKRVKVAENMVSIDYFIGDIDYIHKGWGPKILLRYIESEIKKHNYKMMLISPNPENVANRKCIEKCGFEYIKTVGVPFMTSKAKEALYVKKI